MKNYNSMLMFASATCALVLCGPGAHSQETAAPAEHGGYDVPVGKTLMSCHLFLAKVCHDGRSRR
jgi:hypothetical protein